MTIVDPFVHAKIMLKSAIKAPNQKQRMSIMMPFAGEKYNFIKERGRVYVEGWSGELVIDKLAIYRDKTYYFKEPIVLPNTKIYGMFDGYTKDGVQELYTDAKIMFHGVYDKRENGLKNTCWREARFHGKCTLKELRRRCSIAADALTCVYADTIHGDICCPDNSKYKDVVDYLKHYE